jgi:hypothetical protein
MYIQPNLNIQGRNQSQLPFFTTSTPLNTLSAFALITRTRQLWLQSFENGTIISNYEEKVPEYDIHGLVPSLDDKILYAFARRQGRLHEVVLLRIPMPVRKQPPSPERITVIPGFSLERGDFAAVLMAGDRVKYMVIATISGSIIKICLPA